MITFLLDFMTNQDTKEFIRVSLIIGILIGFSGFVLLSFIFLWNRKNSEAYKESLSACTQSGETYEKCYKLIYPRPYNLDGRNTDL